MNPSTFGEHLRKARMDAGLNIRELGETLGVTEDTVINWEVRGRMPTRGNMERVRMVMENPDFRNIILRTEQGDQIGESGGGV
jgi:predicted transcriptional regulator